MVIFLKSYVIFLSFPPFLFHFLLAYGHVLHLSTGRFFFPGRINDFVQGPLLSPDIDGFLTHIFFLFLNFPYLAVLLMMQLLSSSWMFPPSSSGLKKKEEEGD